MVATIFGPSSFRTWFCASFRSASAFSVFLVNRRGFVFHLLVNPGAILFGKALLFELIRKGRDLVLFRVQLFFTRAELGVQPLLGFVPVGGIHDGLLDIHEGDFGRLRGGCPGREKEGNEGDESQRAPIRRGYAKIARVMFRKEFQEMALDRDLSTCEDFGAPMCRGIFRDSAYK